jgi:hypothetical protein
MRSRLSLVFVLLLHSSHQTIAQSAGEQNARKAVVFIQGQIDGDTVFGGGIIFSKADDRLYIATANHVVRRGAAEATNLRVRLYSLPGEEFEATILRDQDSQMDLAVLRVIDRQREIPNTVMDFNILGDAPSLKRGDAVFPIGHPEGRRWSVPVNADRVDQNLTSEVSFQSTYVRKGNSGGALFDDKWRLVGMVVRDEPPDATAISATSVSRKLASWGYTVGWKTAAPTTSSDPPAPRNAPPNATAEPANQQPAATTITLRYLGDLHGCGLDLNVNMGGKSFKPTSNLYQVDGVKLGPTPYSINGRIACSIGNCSATGSGNITVYENSLFDVSWANNAIGACAVILTPGSNE